MTTALTKILVGAGPFFATALFYFLAPQMSRLVRERVIRGLPESKPKSGSAGVELPPHSGPEYMGDYLEYAIDAGQVVPAVLLPVICAIIALNKGIGTIGAILLVIIGAPSLIALALKVLLADPIDYVANKYFKNKYFKIKYFKKRYTYLPAAAMVLNFAGGTVVAASLLISG